MAADLGMLGGIGQGLSSFADSYQKAKQMDQTNELNQQYVGLLKQQQQSKMLGEGMVVDPTSGNIDYDDIHKKIHELAGTNALTEAQRQKANDDPNSLPSKTETILHRTIFNNQAPGGPDPNNPGKNLPGLGDQIVPDGMSYNDLQQNRQLVNEVFKAQTAEKQHEGLWKAMDSVAKTHAQGTVDAANVKSASSQDVEQMKGDFAKQIADLKGNQVSEKELKAAKNTTRKAIDSDEQYKNAKSVVDSSANANKIISDMESGNSIDANIMPIVLTRMTMGKSGKINIPEIQSHHGGKNIDNVIDELYEKAANGTMSAQDIKDYKQMTASSNEIAQQNMLKAQMVHINQYAYDHNLVPEQAFKDIMGVEMPKAQPQQAAPAKSQRRGLIKKPETGFMGLLHRTEGLFGYGPNAQQGQPATQPAQQSSPQNGSPPPGLNFQQFKQWKRQNGQ